MSLDAGELGCPQAVRAVVPEEGLLSLASDQEVERHPCAPERRLLLGILEQAVKDWSRRLSEVDRRELDQWFNQEPLEMRFGGFGYILEELYGDAEALAPGFRSALTRRIRLPYRKEGA